MIGYLSGKYLAGDGGEILVDVDGVGYSILVSSKFTATLVPGAKVELFIHTNLREWAIELFGFSSAWEKKAFYALTTVSGVGPRTAVSVLGELEAEAILSAIVREDRVTLTSVPGIGKKTAERLIVELGEKARKLLAERPQRTGSSAAVAAVATPLKASKSNAGIPRQGASASPGYSIDIADLWNDALAALVNLGYREGDALAAIKMASTKVQESGASPTLEKLIMSSLQLMSKGL